MLRNEAGNRALGPEKEEGGLAQVIAIDEIERRKKGGVILIGYLCQARLCA